jgi:hypothetical protein
LCSEGIAFDGLSHHLNTFINTLNMEQIVESKNPTAHEFEMNPLIVSPSEKDIEPAVAVSGQDIPRHGFSAETSQSTAFWRTREPLSRSTIVISILDLVYIIGPILFIVFGCLVYIRRDQPVDEHMNARLLAAARYVRTIAQIYTISILTYL